MPSEHPILVALRGEEGYARFLDRLLREVRRGGVQVETRHQLAEYALVALAANYGLLAPRRMPPKGPKPKRVRPSPS